MLHRLSPQGLICITQPCHAWVSGQRAQAWGNETAMREALESDCWATISTTLKPE